MKKLTTNVLAIVLSSSFVMLSAQEKENDTVKTKEIDAVRIVGYRKTTKRKNVSSVSTLKAKKLENKANANIINVMQGKVAGVNIASGSGQPGSKPTVIIRGVGTYSGSSDPLYVIDGFPTNSDSFSSLNPNDVETIDILKDAAAIAEYGNRGANGVIVIKTKSGRFNNKTSFRYRTTTGISLLQRPKYNYANAKELLTIEKMKGVGVGANLSDSEIANYAIDTNWRDVFFRPGFSTSHDFSITSGSKNVNSYTSVGYLNQEGILKQTGLQRFTLRNTINGRTKSKKFKYSLVSGVAYTKSNLASSLGTGGVNQNYVLGAYTAAPHLDPSLYTDGASLVKMFRTGGQGLLLTPLMLMDKMRTFKFYSNNLKVNLASDLRYEILPGLDARVRTSGEFLNRSTLSSQHPLSFNSLYFIGNKKYAGTETIGGSNNFVFNNLWQLNYEKKINKHTFVVNVNTEYNFSQLNSRSFTQNGLNPKTFTPGTGSGYVEDIFENPDGTPNDDYVPEISASKYTLNMISYFGSLEYDFDKKFGLVGTIRRDGSSVFAPGNKWGTFWSVGGRWNLDQEEFVKNIKHINELKLRGSFGTIGNQRFLGGSVYGAAVSPYYTNVYTLNDNVYDGEQGFGVRMGYEDLRWEITKQYGVGVDFRLFNRLSGSFDYYNKKTEDMFFPIPTSPGFGQTSLRQNSEIDLVNKGFELDLKYDIIKKRDLKLSVYANGSINDQVIDGITENNGEVRSGSQITVNGGLPREYYVYEYAGVNQSNGNLLFYDKDGNTTENPVEEDRKRQGVNSLPKYQGGFGFNINYKGFFAATDFTFVAKVSRFDYDLSSAYDSETGLGNFNVSRDLLDAWTPQNTNTNIPSLNASLSAQSNSNRFLRDASYLRLRNARVGYSLSKKLLRGTFVKGATINLQAENLVNFTKWRGFDPESNRASDQYQYPTPRIFSVGLDVKF